MQLNKEMSKKYKSILKKMPIGIMDDTYCVSNGVFVIRGCRVYNGLSLDRTHYEIDIDVSCSIKWRHTVKAKNSSVRQAVENTLRRYLMYVGIEGRFWTNSFGNTIKIKKITFVPRQEMHGSQER